MNKYTLTILPKIQEKLDAKAAKIIDVKRGEGNKLTLTLKWELNHNTLDSLVFISDDTFYVFSHLLNMDDYGYYIIYDTGRESWCPTEVFETKYAYRDQVEQITL